MSDTNQETFIRNIRYALGKPPEGNNNGYLFNIPPDDLDARLKEYTNRSSDEKSGLLEELALRADAVQMALNVVPDIHSAAQTISGIIMEKSPEWGTEKHVCAWDYSLLKELDLESYLIKDKIGITYTRLNENAGSDLERKRIRKDIEVSFIGITSADFVVAHTATMVMKSRPGQLRSVSLVPSIHICVVSQNQIISDLEELYIRLQWEPCHKEEELTNCMTFISAPSKTGDIELVMVNGAHGPREVHLIVVQDH